MTRKFPFTIRQVAKILDLRIRYDNPDNGNMDVDCPFCEEKSKMNLCASKNLYRCNSCNKSGGMVELYGKVYSISNTDAYREICEVLDCSTKVSADNVVDTAEQPKLRTTDDIIHQTYSMLY